MDGQCFFLHRRHGSPRKKQSDKADLPRNLIRVALARVCASFGAVVSTAWIWNDWWVKEPVAGDQNVGRRNDCFEVVVVNEYLYDGNDDRYRCSQWTGHDVEDCSHY